MSQSGLLCARSLRQIAFMNSAVPHTTAPEFSAPAQAELRIPDEVMRLSRMGSMWPTRLSFLRVLTRALAQHGTPPERQLWEMDDQGYGRAVFSVRLYDHDYSLVALSQPLAPENRSDRVIATAWDAAFVLFDGIPKAEDIDRIAREAPKQEAGRFSERELVLSRANKSVRLWDHVTHALRAGGQPDAEFINQIGYLMRTTAVYGNGKFGIADRALFAHRRGLEVSFMVEMLTVWLIRHFTHMLVEHVGGAELDPKLKRHLGIGNATGLGMAPFLVTHPILLNNWMMVRETALARVRAVTTLSQEQAQHLRVLSARASQHLDEWNVPDPEHQARIDQLRADWAQFVPLFDDVSTNGAMERLWQAGQSQSCELQELLLSLMLEPFGEIIDGLADCLTDPFGGTGTPVSDTAAMADAIKQSFSWATCVDYDAKSSCQTFWYVSEEKLEPRIGNRHLEPGAERESPLDIARRVAALARDLPSKSEPLREFLLRHPEHLMAVERVQIALDHPYSEIRDNLIDATTLPIDMLRAKLAMFGATKFDPKSDLWTRITLAQGAPLASDFDVAAAQDWWAPVLAT